MSTESIWLNSNSTPSFDWFRTLRAALCMDEYLIRIMSEVCCVLTGVFCECLAKHGCSDETWLSSASEPTLCWFTDRPLRLHCWLCIHAACDAPLFSLWFFCFRNWNWFFCVQLGMVDLRHWHLALQVCVIVFLFLLYFHDECVDSLEWACMIKIPILPRSALSLFCSAKLFRCLHRWSNQGFCCVWFWQVWCCPSSISVSRVMKEAIIISLNCWWKKLCTTYLK